MSTLRSQRKAQGLCMKCGEKWSKQHKCLEKISMHVLEEVLAALQFEEGAKTTNIDSSDEEDEEDK